MVAELARSNLKHARNGGRTPFDILAEAMSTGDMASSALWTEYEKATKGRGALTWSRGLRKLLAADEELTDEEIAAKEVGGEVVARVDGRLFREIDRKAPGATARLLSAFELGGMLLARAIIHSRGFDSEQIPDPFKFIEN